MRLMKQNSIRKCLCKTVFCFVVAILFLGKGLDVQAAEAGSNDRDHSHNFNQHYAQNAGYTESDPHQFQYGTNGLGEPVMKTCYSYIIHTYYVMGCSCGTMYPVPGTHEHASSKQHPMTSDPQDCKLGNVPFVIPTYSSCYPSADD